MFVELVVLDTEKCFKLHPTEAQVLKEERFCLNINVYPIYFSCIQFSHLWLSSENIRFFLALVVVVISVFSNLE